MHNMRTIAVKSLASQVLIGKETLQFFAPQAQRLGLHEVALGVFFLSVPQTVSPQIILALSYTFLHSHGLMVVL